MSDPVRRADETTPCPRCGRPGMTPRVVMQTRPPGTYSVAGMQAKLAARMVPVLEHDCGMCIVGTVDVDGRHATFSIPEVDDGDA